MRLCIFGGPPLGLRCVHRVEGVAVQLEHGFVDVGLCHLELSQHLGNGELGVLELRDGPAECLPLRNVVQRPGKRRTGARAGGDGDAQAFEREVRHEGGHAPSHLAEQKVAADPCIVEE